MAKMAQAAQAGWGGGAHTGLTHHALGPRGDAAADGKPAGGVQ
jgi:hypothetical protein